MADKNPNDLCAEIAALVEAKPPSKMSAGAQKLADQLLANLQSNHADPAAYDASRDLRDLKAKPLSLKGSGAKPPALDATGRQKSTKKDAKSAH